MISLRYHRLEPFGDSGAVRRRYMRIRRRPPPVEQRAGSPLVGGVPLGRAPAGPTAVHVGSPRRGLFEIGATDATGAGFLNYPLPETRGDVRAAGEDGGAGGRRRRSDLDATGVVFEERLRAATADLLIPLVSLPGAGVRLGDFLRTRFVELVVHADDIAASTRGRRYPEFPKLACERAESVVAETMAIDGERSGARSVLTAARPGRVGAREVADDA